MPIIEVKNLTKKFKDFVAVDDISFSIEKGEVFAFLGPNGAGKTTTIKMLTTLLKPTSGDIYFDGKNIEEYNKETRAGIGIVFQDPSLDDELTAYENMYFHAVLYGVTKIGRKDKITELLKFVDLWDRRDDLVKTFSGGMKRRLEIARGFLHEPKVLFLDEPTLGLDPQTRNVIWERVKKINKDKQMTVFLTTHYMVEAEQMADKIAIIDHGKIIAMGTVDELKKQTQTTSVEEAFLKLTGKQIRADEASSVDQMRNRRKMFTRR